MQRNIQISHLYWELSHTVKSCLYQSLRKMWLLAMTTLILMNIKDSKKGTMLTEVWHHLKQVVPHLNSIYWRKEILMTLSVIWNCLKNKKNSQVPEQKVESSPPRNEMCFFRNGQNEFKEFFSQENDLLLCNDICSVTGALGYQHDPTAWRFLLTLYNLA